MPNRLLYGACGPALAAALLANGAAATHVAAQSAAQPNAQPSASAAAPDTASLGEVVVTANKRAENIQNVPASVQAISGGKLRAEAVVEFTDLSKVAPALIVRPAEQPVNSDVSIRGIGTSAFSIGVEPSVAVQIDDVPIAIEARAFTGLNDLERVEVLAGPQSTLYGKSASAGLINIVTPKPTSILTGKIAAMATGDGEYDANGVISGPINDTLSYRLSVDYDHFDGNVHNLYTGKDVNGRDLGSLYGKLAWKPTDRFEATLGVNYDPGKNTIGRPFINLASNADLRGNPALPPSVWAPGVTASPTNLNVSNNYQSGNTFSDLGESLRMSYQFDWATLLSITSHEFYVLKDRLDVDEGSSPVIDNRQDNGRFGADQYTQEFRLVSPSDKALRYTAGVFYASDDYTRRFRRGPFFSIANWYATSGAQQEAVFGQIDWDLVKDTTLTGGARYQHERVNYTFLDHANGNAFFSGASPDDFFTYKFALNHKFTRDISAYASYTTGHKGETYDLSTGFNKNRALAGPILPETSESYEVGLRSQFFERRLTLDVTYFNATYDNLQAQGIETLPDGSVNYRLANVGRVGLQGVEFNSAGHFDDLNIGLNVAYLDANIESFPGAQCYPLQTAAEGCAGSPARQNLAGRAPPQAPKWKFALTADYHHSLGALPFEGIVSGIYSYQSTINYSLNQDPQTIQPGYGILNLSAGIDDPAKHWELVVFVNNVTDQHYYADIFNSTGTYGNRPATQVLPPRDFDRYAGVRASYSF